MAKTTLELLLESERLLFVQLQAVRAQIRALGGTPPPIAAGELDKLTVRQAARAMVAASGVPLALSGEKVPFDASILKPVVEDHPIPDSPPRPKRPPRQ